MNIKQLRERLSLLDTGSRLLVKQVALMERSLSDSNNVNTLIQLIGYSAKRKSGSEKWVDYVVRLLGTKDGVELFRFLPKPVLTPEERSRIDDAWNRALGAGSKESVILGEAACYFRHDPARAIKLYEQAVLCAKDDARWRRELAYFYVHLGLASPDRTDYVKSAFAEGYIAIERESHVGERWGLTRTLADFALYCDRLDDAELLIKLLLKDNMGLSSHKFQICSLIGRLHLRKGNMEDARRYLMRATRYGFTDDVSLVCELIETGDFDIAAKFFRACLPTSYEYEHKVRRWEKQVTARRKPNFGALESKWFKKQITDPNNLL